MSGTRLKTRLVLLVRLFLVAFKFVFFFLCSRQLSAETVATLFFINLFITIAVMLAPLETHYNFVRNFKVNTDNVALYARHFSTLVVVTLISCAVLFLLVWEAPFLFPNYLNEFQYSIILVVIFLESINTDCYRYFQINDVAGQVVNLSLRSFVPFLAFLGLVFYMPAAAGAESMILLMMASSMACCLYSLARLGWPRGAADGARWFSPDLSQLRFSLVVALPILLAQVVYTQLDKYLAASVMTKPDYANYSFYSSIGQAALLYAQITFIQPRLADWYAGTPEHALRLRELARKGAELAGLMVLGMGVLILGRSWLPPILQPGVGSVLVVAGHLSLAAATAVAAYLYAAKRDRAALRSDAFLSVSAGILLLLFALRQIDGTYLFGYPLAVFTAALIVKAMVLRSARR